MGTCRLLPAADWPSLAGFIHRHNQRPDGRARCLHAEHGQSVADQAQELAELPTDEALFLVAESDGEPGPWLGMIGAEVLPTQGRGWVRGPLTAALPPAQARAVREQLIAALLQAQPALRRFDAFPAADEATLVEAFCAQGFRPLMQHHVLRLDQPARTARPPAPGISVLAPGAAAPADLLDLHDRLFPNTYLPGPALPASLDADHVLLLASVDDQLAGYVYVQHKPLEHEAYIDYLGVNERSRGRGWGRALLAAAVHWAGVERGLPRVELTVRQDRAPALGLYLGAGFHEVAAGWQLVFERPG